jgi:hypothetical protein
MIEESIFTDASIGQSSNVSLASILKGMNLQLTRSAPGYDLFGDDMGREVIVETYAALNFQKQYPGLAKENCTTRLTIHPVENTALREKVARHILKQGYKVAYEPGPNWQ